MDFNINIKKTETHKQESADGSTSLSFSPVASPSSETEKKVLPEPIELHGDGDIQLRSFTEKERNLAFGLAVRCIVFPGARSNHAISIMRDGLFPVQRALDVADHMLPLCISSISTSSLNIWHELQQLYANAGKNPTYRPEFFENSRKYLLWMRQEELEIDTIIENLKKEPTYQGRLFVGIVEAANLPLNDKGQPVSRPFVLIKVRGSSTVLTTKAIASWAPVWAEDYQLDISDATSDLTLELWDKGTGIGTDYLIGQAIFPLSTLSTQLPVMGWFPVKPKSAPSKNGKGVKPAELHVKLHYTHRIIPPFTSDKGPPAAASAVLTYMQEAKDSYRVLLEQITNFENPTWDQDGVVPFSPDMDWLLTEFGKRYRLGKVHRHLEYLELLVQRAGRMKKAHTENIIENIQIIEQLFVMDDCHVMRPEADALDDIKQQLKFKLERTLSKYSYAFPGAEGVEWRRGALRAVIVLYKELERTAFSQKLANLATGSMDFTYNVLKQHYENPGEFSALCDICSALTNQIQADATNYAPEFKPDLDLVKLSVDTYYTLFRADVESTLEGDLPVSTETFSLYTKLNELHIVLEKLLPGFQGINLAGIFTKYLIMWVHEAKKKLETWCSKAIEVDTWERSSTEQLHSTSVVDIFTSCTSAVRYLVSLDLSLSEAIILFAKASCSIFELYTQKMLKSCVQDIIDAPKALEIIERDHPDYDLSLQVKQKLCVRVNNIEMAREYLDDYSRELEKYVDVHHAEVLDQCTKATLKFLRQKYDELLDIIIGKMNVYMQQCIINLLQNPPPLAQSEFLEEEPPEIADKLQPLFTFINNQLDLFSESLYHSVFIKVLRRVWFALIKDLELFLFPETQEPQEHENVDTRNSQANIIVFLLDKKLIPFFHANGEGLPLNSLKTQCALLKRELELFNVPTPQLMEIYRSIEEVEDEPASEGTVDGAEGSDPIFRLAHLLSILSSRANDEKTPKFVKAKAAILSSQNLAPLLRNTFKLPSGEALVAKYECLNNVGLAVQVYITTNHVCIDSIFANRKIIIPVKAIDVLKKVQGEKLTEKLEGIKVKTGNEEAVLYFTQNRKKAYQQIEEQAHLGGNNRIGEPKSSLPLPSLSVSTTPVPESPAPLVSPLRNVRTEQFTKLKNSFSLPSGESLKTCYTCSLIASVPPGTPGELFITNAGVYFYGKSMGSEAKESFSFSDLKSLTKKNAAFIFSNAILVKTSKKELFFGSFANRDEVYYILEEMWDKFKNQLPPPPDAKISNGTKSK